MNLGRTTWDDLEAAGKCSPRKGKTRGLGQVSKWFMEAEKPIRHDKNSSHVEGGLAEGPGPAK